MEKFQLNELTQPNLHQLGEPHGHGNLLGIAPYMTPQDYMSRESYFNKLNSYLQIAKQEGWLNEKTIALFPEHIGTWLVFANENKKIFQAPTLDAAERMMVFLHPLKFIAYFSSLQKRGEPRRLSFD